MLRPDVAFYGCPYCQGQNHRSLVSAFGTAAVAYAYVRCQECDVVYPWPRLTREALAERVNAPWLNRYLEQAFKITRYWPDHVPFPEREFRRLSGRRVLEVGPGPGQLLDYLQHIGADPLGVEPNVVAAQWCEKRGLRVIQDPFEESLLDHPEITGGFDAVVFLDSIYHLFDLREAFSLVHRLLRKGGQLVLGAFDVDSFLIRYLRGASDGIDGLSIPINASDRTCSRLIEGSGFNVRRIYQCRDRRFLDQLGVERAAIRSRGVRFALRALDKAADLALRVFGQSRNFVLFAEKR